MSESQVRKIDYNGTLTKVGYGLKLHLFLRTMPLNQAISKGLCDSYTALV